MSHQCMQASKYIIIILILKSDNTAESLKIDTDLDYL